MHVTSVHLFQIEDGDDYVQGPISLEQPVGTLPVVDDARWSADLTSNSWGALAVWLVLLIVLQAAMWPLVRRVFSRFPDQGWAFGRLVSLICAGYLVWILASVEVIAFRAIWCGAALMVVAAIGNLPRLWPQSTQNDHVDNRAWYRNRSILTAEAVFWAVFGLFLFFRFINPDSYHPAWGGEKPMEFAHINAILRSAHFPPYDPWYADGLLNYYYYGMYLVAFMMKLTGIPSEIAFNLAQPTMIAFLAAGAFSVVSALTYSLTNSKSLSRIGGLIGVVLMSFSGNLVVFSRLVSSISESAPALSNFRYWFWNPREIVPFTINEFPYFTGTYADLHAHVVALPITVLVIGLCFAVAQNSREMLLTVIRPGAFPRNTVDLGLRLGLLALSLATLFVTNAWDVPVYAALTGVSLLLATRGVKSLAIRLGAVLGMTLGVALVAYAAVIPFSNSYVALYGAIETVREVSPLISVEAHFGVFFLILAFGLSFLLSRLWTNPPLICQPVFFFGALSLVLLARLYASSQADRWVELTDDVTVGLVITWLTFCVLLSARQALDFRLVAWLMPVLALGAWAAVVLTLALDKPACALFLGFGAIASMIWLMLRPSAERFVSALIAAGMFVGAGVELVFLVDALTVNDFYRMNTVFKFYNAIWVMLALASASLVTWMIRSASEPEPVPLVSSILSDVEAQDTEATSIASSPPEDGPAIEIHPESMPSMATAIPEAAETVGVGTQGVEAVRHDVFTGGTSPAWARVGLLVSGIALMASLAYPVFATGARLNQHFAQPGRSWTLNSLDWMDYGTIAEYGNGGVQFSYDEDRDVIEWFNSEVGGSPVIAEASIAQYACAGSRISNYTGLPVVVGWTWHESQQRGWTDLRQRQADLRTLYTSDDPGEKVAMLDRYRIEYVVIGDLERYYPTDNCHSTNNEQGVATFENLLGTRLEVAFRSGDTVVYRVVDP